MLVMMTNLKLLQSDREWACLVNVIVVNVLMVDDDKC